MKQAQLFTVMATVFSTAIFVVPLQSQITISDRFDDGVIDSTMWNKLTGGNAQVIEENGYINLISRISGAVNNAALLNRHQIFGDFDVSADYDLINFAGGDNRFGLRLTSEDPYFWYQYYFHRWSNTGYELICNYGDSTGFQNIASIYKLILNGKLRIVRRGNTLENYYWENNSWQLQTSFTYNIDELNVEIWANSDVNFPSYECHFDNFTLTADSLALPRNLNTPQIILVTDVPNDQGGRVTIKWEASSLDTNVNSLPFYSLWRALPEGKQVQGSIVAANKITRDFNGPAYRMAMLNGRTYVWEWLANQPAHRFPFYTYTAATLYDSMSTTDGKHYFLVSAHTSDPNIFYDSQPDSGYSVDNLTPPAPRNLAAKHDSGNVMLQWDSNTEPDLRQYVLYRSASPNIDPDRIQPFATSTEARFIDANPLPGNSFYIVRAQDIHDNLSPKSNEASVVATGVNQLQSKTPTAYTLHQNHPNPFNPSTKISYAIPTASYVTLKVYNLVGKEIERLVSENQSAGEYEVRWNPMSLPSGVYVYRLQAGEFVATKKLLLKKLLFMK